MARPTQIADLDLKDETVKVATFDTKELVKLRNGQILTAYQDFIDVAQRFGAEFTDSYLGTEVAMPRGLGDAKSKLAERQREWDENLRDYHKALADPFDSSLSKYRRDRINDFARAEGFPVIDWSPVQEQERKLEERKAEIERRVAEEDEN